MKAIDTGAGVSFFKAVMMLYPKEKRLFEDPYAEKLLPLSYRFFLFLMRSPKLFDFLIKSREKYTPGILGWMFCRFRYIDEIIKNCIAEKEIEVIINLGAGMDCRAYTIPGVDSMKYFEMDALSVIKKKKVKIIKALGKLPDHVVYVPVDFEKQRLDTALEKAGYDLHRKTLFILEGVTQYISKKANENIFNYIAQAAPGSKIVFTYVIKSFIDGKYIHDGINVMYKYIQKRDNPLWIYGLNPNDISDYLLKYSLSLIEDIDSEELENRYMKLENLGLKVKIFDIERISFAAVKG